MSFSQWNVHKFFVQDPRIDKEKFVVIAYIEANWFYGLFINTRVPSFVSANPALHPCVTEIRFFTHPFLGYDSWVSCVEVRWFNRNLISDQTYVGRLTDPTIEDVKRAIEKCDKVLEGQKRLMLS